MEAASRVQTEPAGPGKRLRLRALIKTEAVIRKILLALHLPAEPPELHLARPPPGRERAAGDAEDLLN